MYENFSRKGTIGEWKPQRKTLVSNWKSWENLSTISVKSLTSEIVQRRQIKPYRRFSSCGCGCFGGCLGFGDFSGCDGIIDNSAKDETEAETEQYL